MVVWLVALALAPFHLAETQQPTKVPRIAYLLGSNPNGAAHGVEAFRQGLRDLGYIEGKNILVEFRYGDGKVDRIPGLVAEPVKLNVDVLVSSNFRAIGAAKQATKTIPIVMVTSGDPVADGLVDSLARPGGNITGFATLQRDLGGKRLELLTEVIPGLSRVGVLRDTESRSGAADFKEYEAAARTLKIQLQSLEARGDHPDLEGAFQAAANRRVGALITVTNANLFLQQKRIADLAIKNRLPSMFQGGTWVESGGLMSYSTNDIEVFRRAATYVDKILKGTKPADLPVEQPTQFDPLTPFLTEMFLILV